MWGDAYFNDDWASQSEGEGMATVDLSGCIVVVGLGKTGLSCVRHLRGLNERFVVVDTRAAPPGLAELERMYPDVDVLLGELTESSLIRARELILSPGVPVAHPAIKAAVAAQVPVCGDIEWFARAVKSPVVAITGSNGKSTVTAMVGKIARAAGWEVAVGGNFGEPALDLLGATPCDLFVLELSSFQLETTFSLRPTAAVVLNLSPDHMDRYPDFDAYAQAKSRIYSGAQIAVVNLDAARIESMVENGQDVVGFTVGKPNDGHFGLCVIDGQTWLARGDQALISAAELGVVGKHNLANALAAMALAKAAGISDSAVCDGLRRFPGLAHRCENIGVVDGVRYVNDSKGTNIGATVAAIQGLADDSGSIVLIAGGQSKGADFSELADAVAKIVSLVVLIGHDARTIENALQGRVRVSHADDMAVAVEVAHENANPGDTVLLSPACASFDMYSGFAARGDQFRERVEAL